MHRAGETLHATDTHRPILGRDHTAGWRHRHTIAALLMAQHRTVRSNVQWVMMHGWDEEA